MVVDVLDVERVHLEASIPLHTRTSGNEQHYRSGKYVGSSGISRSMKQSLGSCKESGIGGSDIQASKMNGDMLTQNYILGQISHYPGLASGQHKFNDDKQRCL